MSEAVFVIGIQRFSVRTESSTAAKVTFSLARRRRDFVAISKKLRKFLDPLSTSTTPKTGAAFPFPPLPSLVSSESDLPSSNQKQNSGSGAMPAGTRAGPVEWDQVLQAAREGKLDLDTEREATSSSSSSSSSAVSPEIATAVQERLNGHATGGVAATALAPPPARAAPTLTTTTTAPAAAAASTSTTAAAAASSAPPTASAGAAGRQRSRHLLTMR